MKPKHGGGIQMSQDALDSNGWDKMTNCYTNGSKDITQYEGVRYSDGIYEVRKGHRNHQTRPTR